MMTPAKYLESYAGCKTVQVNREDLKDWDKALTARAGSVGRLRAWIRDYGSQKQPQFIADLEAVLSALTAPALGGEVLSALDEACANMSGSVDAILEHFSEHGKIIGDGEWRLREIFKHASEANAEFKKLVAKMIPPPAPTADARDVHTEHCCIHHCKYSDEKCTVTSGQKPQLFPCEDCDGDEPMIGQVLRGQGAKG